MNKFLDNLKRTAIILFIIILLPIDEIYGEGIKMDCTMDNASVG